MEKIILISGKAEAGKDYTANIIKENLEGDGKKVLTLHYADILKYYSRQYFGWNGEKDEYGRTLLQHIGQTVREKNMNYWVEQVCNVINLFEND